MSTVQSESFKSNIDVHYREQSFKKYENILEELKNTFDERFKTNVMANQTGKLDDFEYYRTLGTGAFGRVMLIKHKFDNTYHAMKIMSKAKIVNMKQIEHTENEKHILQSLHFPFVVYLQYCFKDNAYIYIVLPFINGGEMFSHLRKMGKFSESLSRFYAAQVALVLEYLHKCNLIYRDLKPENILIDNLGYIRVVDFGFCKQINNRTWTLCGTPEYLAPEIILSKGYGKSIDWWSFGILLYEMNAGYSPFFSQHTVNIYEKITLGKYHFPQFFQHDLKDLIKNLLQLDLTRRFGNLKNGSLDIKRHKWFEKIDWIKIYNKSVVPSFVPNCTNQSDDSNFDKYNEEQLVIPEENMYEREFENF
ncbi:PREDICTED: cAMP-dependent protein kinase catalytic subunit-like [Ceratosolen solmsi marchali]|uniref:cAMP-dependent protein kinase catalytic subunit-like n=1 Tax=Ceratosolen solmsi marchali TaxID=326594 RepID=A0AAJ6YB79_9HYME|nr:PREDICTED: cAMP-dependent protein kinase catalytic subunit-like [Ceratosolen solmsi marchali]